MLKPIVENFEVQSVYPNCKKEIGGCEQGCPECRTAITKIGLEKKVESIQFNQQTHSLYPYISKIKNKDLPPAFDSEPPAEATAPPKMIIAKLVMAISFLASVSLFLLVE